MPRKPLALAVAVLGLAVLIWAAFTFRRPLEREWRLWQFARAEGEAKKALADRLLALGAVAPVEEWYIGLLASGEAAERALAVHELGAMRSERAIPELIALFGRLSPDGFTDFEPLKDVYDALTRIGAPAVPALIAELRGGSELSRSHAEVALDRFSPELTDPGLTDLLRSREDPEYARVTAIELLGGRHVYLSHYQLPSDALALLVELLGDGSEAVREAAARKLISERAVEAAPALIDTLGRSRAAAGQRSGAPDTAARALAARVLLELEEEFGDAIAAGEGILIDALGDREPTVRRAAAVVLGRLGGVSEAARGALLAAAVDDEEHRVRHAAVRSAARYGPLPDHTVGKLVDDFAGGTIAGRGALVVLGELGPRVVPGLLAALAGDEDVVREHAVAAFQLLGEAAERQAAPGLAELVATGPPGAQVAAIWALAGFDEATDAAEPAIYRALAGAEPRVRTAALLALAYLGVGAGAVPAVARHLEDPDAAVRRAAADALGACGLSASAAVPALTRLLDDEDAGARERAAVALARIAGPDASEVVPVLVRLLGSDDFLERRRAARALAAIGPAAAAAEPALLRVAADEYAGVREAAAEALDRIRRPGGE
jgi:HEAT repeat protein